MYLKNRIGLAAFLASLPAVYFVTFRKHSSEISTCILGLFEFSSDFCALVARRFLKQQHGALHSKRVHQGAERFFGCFWQENFVRNWCALSQRVSQLS